MTVVADEIKKDFLYADKMMFGIIICHAFVGFFITSKYYGQYELGFFVGSIVLASVALSYWLLRGSVYFRIIAATSLMIFSALYIQQHLGRIEMHFHIFIALAILTIYKDCLPMLWAALVTTLYHFLLNYLQSQHLFIGDYPVMIFNYGCGIEYVYLHTVMVAAEASVLFVVTQSQTRDFKRRLRGEQVIQNQKKELQDNLFKLEGYKQVLDAASIVSITDPSGKIKYVNSNFEAASGYSKEEVIGKSHGIIRHPNTPKEVFIDMWETLKRKEIWFGHLENSRKDGGSYFVDITIAPILDSDGEVSEYIAARHEVTDLMMQKEELLNVAKTDILTGLGNRRKLGMALYNTRVAGLALVDINRFHEINDFYGTDIGDRVIICFSKLLVEMYGSEYEIFHLQGDEFAILNSSKEKKSFISDMECLNEEVSNNPVVIDEKIISISTTTVLSFEQPSDIISTAGMAQSYAKQKKERFVIYSEATSLQKEYEENMKWTKKIKEAIEDDRIVVYYQPIVDAKSSEIRKHEALVRLIDDSGKVISPYFFLDRAKKSGQYLDITKIVVEKTLALAKKTNGKFSINLTIEDILSRPLTDFLHQKLSNFGASQNITFELVESEGIENFEEVNSFIKQMQALGCKFAIDDFGTGYSNFEYLLKLNTEFVKIDGSLIKQLDTNQDHYDIVKTIVEFAKIKNLTIIAEFVSSEAILQKVLELGIPLAQGYYFSEPLDLNIQNELL